MAWKLRVSARKGEFTDAVDRAEPIHHGELHPASAAQVAAVKELAKATLAHYELDNGMVGLNVTGDGGVASGLLAFSMSVASEPFPPGREPVSEPQSAAATEAPAATKAVAAKRSSGAKQAPST